MVNTLTWNVLAFLGAKESYGYIGVYIYIFLLLFIHGHVRTFFFEWEHLTVRIWQKKKHWEP